MCFRHDQYLYAHTAVFVGDDLVLCFLQFHCIGTRLECLQLHFLYWFKEVFLDVKLFSDESFLGFCHTTLLPLYVSQLNLEQVHQRRCRITYHALSHWQDSGSFVLPPWFSQYGSLCWHPPCGLDFMSALA